MAQIDELLELLNTLILFYVENLVTTDKVTLQSLLMCLQFLQTKLQLLQTQTQRLHDELQWNNIQHYKLFFVENNPLFNFDDDNYDP